MGKKGARLRDFGGRSTGTPQTRYRGVTSSGCMVLPLIWLITSKMHLNLYYLPVSCCKELPSVKKKNKIKQYYVKMTFSLVFFLGMMTFWFYVMPAMSKRGKRSYKAIPYTLQILNPTVSSKLMLHEDLRSERVNCNQQGTAAGK